MARSTVRLALIGALAALALSAGTAKADLLPGLLGGNCGATSQAFGHWGDPWSYYFAPNGGFESGATGWTLAGVAEVVAGNEPFYVHGGNDRSSLALANGASVTTPSLCYGATYPAVRFFATSTTGLNESIRVRVKVRSLLGVLTILDGGSISVGPDWSPTPIHLTLGSALASVAGAKTFQIQLIPSGGVQIDDFYVDPLIQEG